MDYHFLSASDKTHREQPHSVDSRDTTALFLWKFTGSLLVGGSNPPAISPSNMAGPATVEPVRITAPQGRTTQDVISSRPDSRTSRATSALARKIFPDQYPAIVGSNSLRSQVSLLSSWFRLLVWLYAFSRHASALLRHRLR